MAICGYIETVLLIFAGHYRIIAYSTISRKKVSDPVISSNHLQPHNAMTEYSRVLINAAKQIIEGITISPNEQSTYVRG